jgi:hypothetical protein
MALDLQHYHNGSSQFEVISGRFNDLIIAGDVVTVESGSGFSVSMTATADELVHITFNESVSSIVAVVANVENAVSGTAEDKVVNVDSIDAANDKFILSLVTPSTGLELVFAEDGTTTISFIAIIQR